MLNITPNKGIMEKIAGGKIAYSGEPLPEDLKIYEGYMLMECLEANMTGDLTVLIEEHNLCKTTYLI